MGHILFLAAKEENKNLRLQIELGHIKQEIDKKIHEKEEDFENER